MMRCGALIGFFWLATACAAFGLVADVAIGPKYLDQGTYIFTVTNTPATNGYYFHVTMDEGKEKIPHDTGVGIGLAGYVEHGEIIGDPPRVPIHLMKTDHRWSADFIIPENLLKNKNICLEFIVGQYAITASGARIDLPDAINYEIMLPEFINQGREPHENFDHKAP